MVRDWKDSITGDFLELLKKLFEIILNLSKKLEIFLFYGTKPQYSQKKNYMEAFRHSQEFC